MQAKDRLKSPINKIKSSSVSFLNINHNIVQFKHLWSLRKFVKNEEEDNSIPFTIWLRNACAECGILINVASLVWSPETDEGVPQGAKGEKHW